MITYGKTQVSDAAPKQLACLDEAANVLFSRSLEAELPDLVRTETAPTSVRELFPVNSGFSPTAETISWKQVTAVGAAKIITDYATDIPIVNLFAERKSTQVRTIGAATSFNIMELQQSAEPGNVSLVSEGPVTARDAILLQENALAYNGSAADSMVGLFSGTAVTGIAITASNGVWSAATGVVIFAELAALVSSVHEDSKTVHSITRVLMSPANLRIMRNTDYNATNGDSVFTRFKESYPEVTIIAVQEMVGAGAKGGMGGSDDAVFAYNPDPSEIQLALPMAIAQRPPVEGHFTIETAYWSRTGGFIIRKPLAMKFLEGT